MTDVDIYHLVGEHVLQKFNYITEICTYYDDIWENNALFSKLTLLCSLALI